MNQLLTFAACAAMGWASTMYSFATPTDKDRTTTDISTSISLHNIVNGHYNPEYVYGVRPAEDGESYTQLSQDARKIIRKSFKNGKEIEVLFDVAHAKGPKQLESIDNYILSPDGRHILLQTETHRIYRRSYTAVYYIYDTWDKNFVELSQGGPQQVPLFSPDGSMIAFARDNNLFLVKLFFDNAEVQVTQDGKVNEIINGIPDWVNEEEFTTNRSFDFSADSKVLAWIRYDERNVPIYPIPMYKGAAPTHEENDEYPGAFLYKYPVAGAENSVVTVKTFEIKSRVTRTLNIPMEKDGYIPRIHFTNDPSRLAVVTLNRHQDQMDIYMVNPLSTIAKLSLREKAKCYVSESGYEHLTFYPDQFVISSDRSGYKQLYLYSLNGQLLRPLTKGNYDVTDFYGYDPSTGDCYYQSAEESPLNRAIYKSDKRGKVVKLSQHVGTNAATFSKNFKYFMNVYSNTTTPPVTTLCSESGKEIKTLIDNQKLKQEVASVSGQKEFFTVKTADNVLLNGWMIKPKNFNPNHKYPVLMYQYSGPGSQEVTDSWRMGFYGGGVYESYLTEHGYIVACVDGRGTGARGAEFEKCTYLHLGELESKDQNEAALYLGSLPYVDKDRIGIWGWSFGGFNTLMSMSDPRGLFKAGIAVAAPSNWKFYDTIYTERYMRTPKENPYYSVNPISRVNDFKGSLLLVHGTADDNVHFRNCAEYAEAMVQANKQFQMQVYTNRNHFITGGNTRFHLFTRMTEFLLNNL